MIRRNQTPHSEFWTSDRNSGMGQGLHSLQVLIAMRVSCITWKVDTGRLLKKWHAHYRPVTCLVFSEDDSLLITGSEDGCVRVWIFDDLKSQEASNLYMHSFSQNSLLVTDVVIGNGGANAIIVSASEDRTCKVWLLFLWVVLMYQNR
ncbi:hypothetical protein RIF29_18089 [Crotalaria pallida]|uniref:Uncharacterized protein n=1 Tax=Crotalaria pallida TaxID=3830 RepID=A0AAN9IH27_CROPI